MACCGADLMPLRCVSTPTQGVITLASSAPVTTAITPGAFFAAAVVDRCDAGMRVRRAQKATCAMRGSATSLTYCAAPLRQPRQVRPRHRAADIGIRPVERGEDGRQVVDDFHYKNRVGHNSAPHMGRGTAVEAKAFLRLLEVAADDVDEVVKIDLGVRIERIDVVQEIRREVMYHLCFRAR